MEEQREWAESCIVAVQEAREREQSQRQERKTELDKALATLEVVDGLQNVTEERRPLWIWCFDQVKPLLERQHLYAAMISIGASHISVLPCPLPDGIPNIALESRIDLFTRGGRFNGVTDHMYRESLYSVDLSLEARERLASIIAKTWKNDLEMPAAVGRSLGGLTNFNYFGKVNDIYVSAELPKAASLVIVKIPPTE